MIYYDRDTTVEAYAKLLQEHSFTPNLDAKILEIFCELQKVYANFKAKKALLALDITITRRDATTLAKKEYPYILLDIEIEKLVKIKELSSKKQKNKKEILEWGNGFDRYGR